MHFGEPLLSLKRNVQVKSAVHSSTDYRSFENYKSW
jgi:hypothetical protein